MKIGKARQYLEKMYPKNLDNFISPQAAAENNDKPVVQLDRREKRPRQKRAIVDDGREIVASVDSESQRIAKELHESEVKTREAMRDA